MTKARIYSELMDWMSIIGSLFLLGLGIAAIGLGFYLPIALFAKFII